MKVAKGALTRRLRKIRCLLLDVDGVLTDGKLYFTSDGEEFKAFDVHPQVALGVAAPYEGTSELEYVHLFSMDWSLITPAGHPLARKKRLRLSDLIDLPLILFEHGSTGRQHVMDAFRGEDLSPRVDMETTNTEIIVRMVEAGLGLSVVPLMPGGEVTRGRKVEVRGLGKQIRPIHSGILRRRGEKPSEAVKSFLDFLVPRRSDSRQTLS